MSEGMAELRCSFCGRPRKAVHRMAMSPLGALICDECVLASLRLMLYGEPGRTGEPGPGTEEGE